MAIVFGKRVQERLEAGKGARKWWNVCRKMLLLLCNESCITGKTWQCMRLLVKKAVMKRYM